ncbi:MAG: GNAT family N-acetyltransferase [Pseudomonadota bacterium]
MSAKLTLCGPSDLSRLDPLVAAFHAEMALESSAETRATSLAPLLDGSPYGAAYLIGPARAPVGYLVVTFSWSIEFGGLEATLDEIWIRPAVRGRGMAGEALAALLAALAPTGVTAVSLEAERGSAAFRLYERLHFAPRDRYVLMSRKL